MQNIGETFFGGSHFLANNTLTGIGRIVSIFLNLSFVLSGLILLFFFILGGIGLIGSAGNSDPQKMEQAKKTLTSAVLGFVIVFASYWIVKLIGSLIGVPDLIF